MASIPAGSAILNLDEALTYFSQRTPRDRATARRWIDETGVTEFYVPPSGGYVAGHGGPNRSAFRDMPVNGLVMHVGFLHAWPNDADIGEDVRIELSNSRGQTTNTGGRRSPHNPGQDKTCPKCFMLVPQLLDECEECGHDFTTDEPPP